MVNISSFVLKEMEEVVGIIVRFCCKKHLLLLTNLLTLRMMGFLVVL